MAVLIDDFNIERLTNNGHYEFAKQLSDLLKKFALITEKATAQAGVFNNKVEAEDEVLNLTRKSEQTGDIAAYDRQRDAYYSTYKRAVKNYVRTLPAGEMLDAAEDLQQNITDYKIDTRAQLANETAGLLNMTGDLKGKLATQVEALGLTKLVDNLKEANDQVHTLLTERNIDNSTREAGAVKEARAATDAAYENLVLRVNALSVVDGDNDYEPFINALNTQIDYFRKKVVTKRKSSKTDSSDASDEETPTEE